ncbi:hypothetical protein LIS44_15305 (plasmid) [Acinetobacter haemolyticus]|nr:hypothetical protein LIS44_15305 [Acinetobacter haemolyticus]
MGEWSEYFEDFPEENPANQPNRELDLGPRSKYFPNWHESQLTKAELAEIAKKIEAEKAELERQAEEKARYIQEIKSHPVFLIDICPICNLKTLNIYQISDDNYFGECQECGASDTDTQPEKILQKIENLIWSQSQDLDEL